VENLTAYYYEKIGNTNNPGTELAKFFCELFERQVTKSEIILFNKLVKAFGRYTTYFAIIDMWGSNPEQVLDHNWAALTYYCKRRLDKTNDIPTNDVYKNLTSFIEKKQKEIEELKKEKLKIRSLDE